MGVKLFSKSKSRLVCIQQHFLKNHFENFEKGFFTFVFFFSRKQNRKVNKEWGQINNIAFKAKTICMFFR